MQYMASSIGETTRNKYDTYTAKYIKFCASMNLMAFPVHEHNMVLFVTYLGALYSYCTIKIYTAAIKYSAYLHGFMTRFDEFKQLHMVLQGIKRTQGKKILKPKRDPITPQILSLIKANLFNSSRCYTDKCMIWAAMLVAFFGFLRVSEFTSTHVKSYHPLTTLCVEDVRWVKNMRLSGLL